MTNTAPPPAAWYPDPTGRHQHRYWDGAHWTVQVADDGVIAIDDGRQQPDPLPARDIPPEWQQTPTPGWTEVPAKPTPTPTYSWPSSTTSSGWAGSATPAAATPVPVRSSTARNWVVAIAILVAMAGVGATALLALGGNEKSGVFGSSDGQRYPAIVETQFVTGCTATGGTVDYCRCALTHLEEDYDLGELSEMGRTYASTGKLPDSVMSVVQECLPQQVTPQTQQ